MEPGKNWKRPFSVKTTAAAVCTILAVILVIVIFCAQKPAERTAAKGSYAQVAATSRQGLTSPGSALPISSPSIDPMLYPEYRQASASSTPSIAALVPSAAPSVQTTTAISRPIHSATPAPESSSPPSLISLQYPTGAPQIGRHGTAPSSESEKHAAAPITENLTKEEKLAQLIKANINDIEPSREVHISPENDYSISVPSGYYLIKKKGTNTLLLVAFDDTHIESSLRMIQVTASPLPEVKPEIAVAGMKMSLINSEASITEEKYINSRGGNSLLYQGYSFTYNFGPPPNFHVENIDYTHQDIYFAHNHSGKAYRVKFSAPKQSFSTYERSEFTNALRSLHFTIDD